MLWNIEEMANPVLLDRFSLDELVGEVFKAPVQRPDDVRIPYAEYVDEEELDYV